MARNTKKDLKNRVHVVSSEGKVPRVEHSSCPTCGGDWNAIRLHGLSGHRLVGGQPCSEGLACATCYPDGHDGEEPNLCSIHREEGEAQSRCICLSGLSQAAPPPPRGAHTRAADPRRAGYAAPVGHARTGPC